MNKLIFQILIVFSVLVAVMSGLTMIIIPASEKLSDQYVQNIEYDAQTTMVYDVYGDAHGPFFQRDMLSEKVIEKNGNVLTIKSSVIGKKIGTNEIMFQMENTYKVDAITQMHIDKEGKRFGFLPGVEKKDYDFFHPAVFYDDPMMFKKTDIIQELEVYIFEVTTKGADTSQAFPQFAPHVIFTDTTSKLWIEPITGNLIKFEKNWDNYLVEDGIRINTIQQGEKKTTEFTERILAQFAKTKMIDIQFYHVILPMFSFLLILSLGGTWITVTYLRKIKQDTEKNNLVTIGQLSSRLAHDIRNPLSIIQITLDNLKLIYGENEAQKKQFEKVQRSIFRITHQIDDVLDFVKKQPLTLNKTKISDVISDALDSLFIPNDIQLKLPKNDFELVCDSKKLSIAFNNIILNAIQAMNGKGLIAIGVEETDDKVIIEIEDSGKGISKKDLKKIFVPLFTTKQKGTGLGLASVKSIIEAHGGTISVTSTPTIFRIELPKNQ